MDPPIAIVRSTRPWAPRLNRYLADHGGARVRLRPLDERDLLEEDVAVAVVDDISVLATRAVVDELHRRGRSVLGVYDPAEPAGKERLRRLGVDAVIEADAEPGEFVVAIHDLAPALPTPGGPAKWPWRVRLRRRRFLRSSTVPPGIRKGPPVTAK